MQTLSKFVESTPILNRVLKLSAKALPIQVSAEFGNPFDEESAV